MKKPFLFLILMSLGGCQSDTGEGVANGTETNWLTACDSSEDCGVGSCVCGLCTFECSEASDCDQAPEAARCATGTDDAFRRECAGSSVTGLCLAASDDGEDDDTADDDDARDDDVAGDDASGDDDVPEQDDDTSAADDDLSSDDDGADDDTTGADDDTSDPEDDDGTGGTSSGGSGGANGGAGSGGGDGGSAGTSNGGGCREGCSEVCADDVCGCVCDPEAPWAACDAPSDCVLVPGECCSCTRFDAVHFEGIQEHELDVCPDGGASSCESACQPEPDPYRVASCIAGICAVVQLDETPLTECVEAADCALTEPSCCASCMPVLDPLNQLVAIDAERRNDLRGLLCNPEGGCLACETPFPESHEAVCNAGRCAVAPVASSCPAPTGVTLDVTIHDGGGGGFQCARGAVAPTLLTSADELSDFGAQCGTTTFDAPLVVPQVDFGSRVLFAAVGFETLNLGIEYVVQASDGIHVGALREQYCGGAAPPDSVVFVEMNPTALDVVQDSCSTGMCSGPLPP